MSDGNEFRVRGAATEKARRASSVRVLGTFAVQLPAVHAKNTAFGLKKLAAACK